MAKYSFISNILINYKNWNRMLWYQCMALQMRTCYGIHLRHSGHADTQVAIT